MDEKSKKIEKEEIIGKQKNIIMNNQNEINAIDSVNQEINLNWEKSKKLYLVLERRYQNLKQNNCFLLKKIKSLKLKKFRLQEKNNKLKKKFESVSKDYKKIETELTKRKLIFQKYFG